MGRVTAMRVALGISLLALGLWQAGSGALIHAKAIAAQILLAEAWGRTRAGETAAKPWPWADTWPVARLSVARLGASMVVLADASGRSLAFGPGHVQGTAAPGMAGTSIIAGHRDTHFLFLRDLVDGDEIALETAQGHQVFRVVDTQVVDADSARLVEGDEPVLTLVTCYPFDSAAPGGTLRYVVTAAEAAP
jgi:sortase A